MNTNLFSKFAPVLRGLTDAELTAEIERPDRLLITSGTAGGRRTEIAYAPFDHVNNEAEIVIVGLTPGRQQMRNALTEARRWLMNGSDEIEAVQAAKVFASFSGPMRTNLVAMLDSIGISRHLGLASTATLWNGDARRVHFTSALRYPVFIDGKNYSGAPEMTATPLLRQQLMTWFADEMTTLPNAVFIPLGPKVGDAVEAVARHVGLDTSRVLSGLPHPSGANAERIAFFLGRKPREHLSDKVEPERLIAARATLQAKMSGLEGS
jgi:hypothetical protein